MPVGRVRDLAGSGHPTVRNWEASGEIGVVKKADIPTIAEAVERSFTDLKAQQLSETIWKYHSLLKTQLLPWCESKGHRYLKQMVSRKCGSFAHGTAPRGSRAAQEGRL
jgi:hypothetical protein